MTEQLQLQGEEVGEATNTKTLEELEQLLIEKAISTANGTSGDVATRFGTVCQLSEEARHIHMMLAAEAREQRWEQHNQELNNAKVPVPGIEELAEQAEAEKAEAEEPKKEKKVKKKKKATPAADED